MGHTVNEIFEQVIPYIPEKLISRDVIAVITGMNEKFPAQLISGGLFECPLSESNPVSDLSLIIDGQAGREIIAGKADGISIHSSLYKSPAWGRIQHFCKIWSQPEGLLHEKASKLWLEFDLDSMRKKAPVPGVFFGVCPSEEKGAGIHDRGKYDWIMKALESLKGKQLKKEIKDKLVYCLDSFPDCGGLAYVALMLSRPVDAVRIVADIPDQNLKEYLAEIKYPGDIEEISDLVSELAQFTLLRYNLDISREMLPKIGIECFPKGRPETHKELWPGLMDHLAARYPLLREKSDSLLSWSGQTLTTLPFDSEPSYIFRRISHIKLTCERDKPLYIKAYPAFNRIFEIDVLFERLAKSSPR